ncbi:PEP-CTERM sorting domain-containing protein [Roseateles sp.]|uniref:PEP-CTERM sorting domain-containing protein n=1 Tax=Roseateles sp. TaxID=1971397 RepID=UPI0032671DDC
MQIHTLSKIAASLLLCGLAEHAGAQTVVFDSYAPGNEVLGWTTPLFQGQDVAIPFDITTATSIQSILTSIERFEGTAGVTLGILSRQGAVPTGASWLYSTHLANPVANTLLTPAGWSLAAGSYWLAAVPDAGFDGQWQSGIDSPAVATAWAYSPDGVWTAMNSAFIGQPAARITVLSAVPEPSTYGLMFAGGLLLAAVARRKSSQQG